MKLFDNDTGQSNKKYGCFFKHILQYITEYFLPSKLFLECLKFKEKSCKRNKKKKETKQTKIFIHI